MFSSRFFSFLPTTWKIVGKFSANYGLDVVAGKSSLTVQFVENHFVESYYPTIENTFSSVIKYKGQDFATEIVDTAGQVIISND